MLEIEVIEVSVTQMGFALMLKCPNRDKVVPIFIGPLETYSISSALENQKSERPLTHDLMKEVLSHIGCHISKVVLDDFKNGMFFAKLHIESRDKHIPQKLIQIDSRPSDAIAMAIRFQAPVFMSEEVYDETSLDLDIMREKIDDFAKGDHEAIVEELPDILTNDNLSTEEGKATELIQNILDELSHSPSERKAKVYPSQKSEKGMKTKVEVLKQMLSTAVKNEKYEEAAQIRDELSRYVSIPSRKGRKKKDPLSTSKKPTTKAKLRNPKRKK